MDRHSLFLEGLIKALGEEKYTDEGMLSEVRFLVRKESFAIPYEDCGPSTRALRSIVTLGGDWPTFSGASSAPAEEGQAVMDDPWTEGYATSVLTGPSAPSLPQGWRPAGQPAKLQWKPMPLFVTREEANKRFEDLGARLKRLEKERCQEIESRPTEEGQPEEGDSHQKRLEEALGGATWKFEFLGGEGKDQSDSWLDRLRNLAQPETVEDRLADAKRWMYESTPLGARSMDEGTLTIVSQVVRDRLNGALVNWYRSRGVAQVGSRVIKLQAGLVGTDTIQIDQVE